ncbi:hypothetical protein [Arthrobacter methylotrophus]|uniref:hypothetical protein n=1 Tax=Arthrobacter methylotrophus TaxID=121291 RepID=UPI0031ED33CF
MGARAADDAEERLERVLCLRQVDLARLGELAPRGSGATAVAAEQLEHEALEVRRARHIHRRARRGERVLSVARAVEARAEELVEDVVLVDREDKLAHGQAHELRVQAERMLPKLPDGTRTTPRRAVARIRRQFVGRTQPRPHVVGDLGRDAAEVDGVDGADVVGALEVDVPPRGASRGSGSRRRLP